MKRHFEQRSIDSDLEYAFSYNVTSFSIDIIDNILAEIAGANDISHWYWVISLKNGQYALIDAWCDYTGWDCQSGVSEYIYNTIEECLMEAPMVEEFGGRKIREQLKRQLDGDQPFGVYIEKFRDE